MYLENGPFNPLVSIVIPVYRGKDFLAEAIDSVLAQTYSNIEIIVVNDGSTDDGETERVALGYGDRIRYFSKPNGGVATALNMAISHARGEYISWLSHDDLYVPKKIEKQVRFLATLSAAERAKTIMYSDYSIFTSSADDDVPIAANGPDPRQFRFWITTKSALHGCTLLIPKAAFTQVGMFDPALRYTQDYDLWFRMAQYYDFRYQRELLVKGRQHANQDSVAMSDKASVECNALLTGFIRHLTPHELECGSGRNVFEGYAMLAQSMWYRGYRQAGMEASKRAALRFVGAPFASKMRVLHMVARSLVMFLVVNPLRPYVHPCVRRKIKNILTQLGIMGRAPVPVPVVVEELPHPDSLEGLALQEKFAQVYEQNIFRGSVSRSGEGSDLVQTEVIRREIPQLVKELGVRRFLDAPCGDWYWMQHVDLPVETYTGLDIVEALIAKNQQDFGNSKVSFQVKNLAQDTLPVADLIFSRDCLVHLALTDALKIIANFKRSGATYLLTTTFVNREVNEDLGSIFWRPLNMELAPFHFPPPLKYINEGCTEGNGMFADKCLGLWRLADIPMPPDTV
jgi:glycosyltransferase involved in cell wall biosynthesis